MNRRLMSLALVALCGCVSIPDTYRPPIERKPMVGRDLSGVREFVAMNDPAASKYILHDIGEAEEGAWRWTGERPTLLFVLPHSSGWKLLMEFAVAEETFSHTGPFHITFGVNGRLLDKVRYDSPGQKRFEKPVPGEWLRPRAENVVTADLDNTYVAEADKKKLGVILTRAGFVR